MAALRRRSAHIEHTAAVPRHDSALVLSPLRHARHSHHVPEGYGFTSTTNLTVISGSDSTFSTMATRTDIPGTGRVIDKFVFQPAGRRIERFIGGIVRRMSTRKERRRESAALLAEDLAVPAREDVAPPYTTRRGRRPLPRVPEMVEVHPTVTPWLAHNAAFIYEQTEQSYDASFVSNPPSEPPFLPPAPIFVDLPFYYGQEGNNEGNNMTMQTSETMAFAGDANSEEQWWQRNAAPQIIVAPPAYDNVHQSSEPRIVMSGTHPIVTPMSLEPVVARPDELISSAPTNLSTSVANEKLMTFCMDDDLVYAPMEIDYDKALTLAQSFFPALASIARERIAFSLHLESGADPDPDVYTGRPSMSPTSLSSPAGAVRVLPAAWPHLCQKREDCGIVHISILPETSSVGSAPKGMPYYNLAEDQLRVADKLLRYAYEGEMVCVLFASDYELATTTAQSAFPALARIGRESIVLSVKKRLADGVTKSIRVPREAWPCLSPRLQDSEVVEISLLAGAAFS